MKSVKYLVVLLCNACFLGFLLYLTADPVDRWLGDWTWTQAGLKVLYATAFAAFLIASWLGIRIVFSVEISKSMRIALASGLALIGSSNQYWNCIDQWSRRDALPDRHAMIEKLQRKRHGFTATNLSFKEYDRLTWNNSWHDVPSDAYHISIKSNGEDENEVYPTQLRYVVPRNARQVKIDLPWFAPSTLVHEVENLGDSIVVRFFYLEEPSGA